MLRYFATVASATHRGSGAIAGIPALLAVALCVASLGATQVAASEHYFPSPCLPPENSQYVAMLHQQYAAGLIDLRNPQHWRFTQCDSPPPMPGGETIHSMGSLLNFQVSMDGGATYQPHSAPGQMTVRVHNSGPIGPGVTRFDTEMLQLDILGGSLPPGVMIRESPTLASTGRTTMRAAGGGGFYIDSFFDVFTELSLDGGQTWMPSDGGAGHVTMEAVNPTPRLPTTWGKIKALYRR